jgi:hypothetical protein
MLVGHLVSDEKQNRLLFVPNIVSSGREVNTFAIQI